MNRRKKKSAEQAGTEVVVRIEDRLFESSPAKLSNHLSFTVRHKYLALSKMAVYCHGEAT